MKTEDIVLFHRIVESSSLSGAADLLNLPKSTVSRRLLALEDELNTKLFHRNNRLMTLTTSGSIFYEKSLKIVADIDAVMIEMTDHQADIVGHLRVLVFPVPELMTMINGIFKFMDENPRLSIEFIISSERKDMIKENIDVAFTIEETFVEEDMVARLVGHEELFFFASPAYIQREGRPRDLNDINNHNSILFRFPNGKMFNDVPVSETESIAVTGNIWVNSFFLAREAALQGRGIAYLPLSMCEHDVENKSLINLFEEHDPYVGKYYLVYPMRRFVSLATRRLIDFMMIELTDDGVPKNERLPTRGEHHCLL